MDVKMSCRYKLFTSFAFKVPHKKLCGSCGIRSHWRFIMDTMLGKVKFTILLIPYECLTCTNIPENQWVAYTPDV